MNIKIPDALDKASQSALIDDLRSIEVRNLPEKIMIAARQGKGGGIVSRLLSAITDPNKLSIHEFIYYRLYDPALPKDEIKRFISFNMRNAHALACNSEDWREPTYDKIVWQNYLERADLPRPKIKAVYRTDVQAVGAPVIEDMVALSAWLRDPDNYPILAKPNHGGLSLGILRLESIEGDRITIHDGSMRTIDEVVTFLHEFARRGYIFQEVLQPHPDIAKITGGSLATMRVVVLNNGPEPILDNITLKLPRSNAVADNFWRGNMLAPVDTVTGAIKRVIIGTGTELELVDTHPDTGHALNDIAIPDIDAVREFAASAAPVFSGVGLQGWDLALTDRGPVPVELNFGGDVNLQQLSHHRGAMSAAYCENLRRAGFSGYLPD